MSSILKSVRYYALSTVRSYNKILLHARSVGDPIPEPDPEPYVFVPPDPDSLVRGTDPASDPDPSLFS
jgi:hypothetical protein